jgi:hypothetical protein
MTGFRRLQSAVFAGGAIGKLEDAGRSPRLFVCLVGRTTDDELEMVVAGRKYVVTVRAGCVVWAYAVPAPNDRTRHAIPTLDAALTRFSMSASMMTYVVAHSIYIRGGGPIGLRLRPPRDSPMGSAETLAS